MAGIKKLNMARWIVALRSGRYKQTQGALRDSNGYCCLGVACNISKLGKWKRDDDITSDNMTYFISKLDSSAGVLPEKVRKWLGVDAVNPYIITGDTSVVASIANDNQGYKFDDIATALEALYLDGKKAKDIVKKARKRAAA